MPTIHLTNNTTLNITASSADGNATLNRYLMSALSFQTLPSFDVIAAKRVADLDPTAFPIELKATGKGQFSVEGTALDVQVGASASVGLLTGDSASDFFSSLQWTAVPAASSLVSFGLTGTLTAGDAATINDFSFGITKAATVGLTSFCTAAGTDTLEDAVERAIAALTIPHDINDLKSLPSNTVCQIDGSGSIQFTASVTYNILNDPLATTSISKLPSIAINATAGVTLEGTATHTSDHTITIAKLPSGLIHLSVNLTRTNDFETSLTVSAGIAANIGSEDALEFLLDKISPNSSEEIKTIRADLPAGKAEQLSSDIKAAIDAALCSSLQASLKTSLDDSQSNSRVFLYEIDLAALDAAGTTALQSALMGDFTTITNPKATLAGIRLLDSALTVTSKITHSLSLHLLGIFNWQSTSAFIKKSKIDYTKDTHEIVLSDEAIEVMTNNLDSDKLREVVLRGITLTLPASANTPAAATPINMVFFERRAATNGSTMRQFVNVLKETGAGSAAGAALLLNQNTKNYGTSSLYLGLKLNPEQCRQLFIDPSRKPYPWTTYLSYACAAEGTILAGDDTNADRLKLFTAGQAFWEQLREAGAAPNKISLLTAQGIPQNALEDVVTIIWWSVVMENYGKALAAGQSLEGPGKAVVKDGTLGFSEPWLILATWKMLQKPAIDSIFTSSLLKRAAGAA